MAVSVKIGAAIDCKSILAISEPGDHKILEKHSIATLSSRLEQVRDI